MKTRSGNTFGEKPKWFGILIAVNVVILAAFWLARVVVMNHSDEPQFRRIGLGATEQPLDMWTDSLYHSAMTQSTIGASDLVPITPTMRVLTGIQAGATILALIWMLKI